VILPRDEMPAHLAAHLAEPVRKTRSMRVCTKCEPPALVHLNQWLDHLDWHKRQIRPRPPITKEQRERIKARDGYACRRCGGTVDLVIHHINGDETDQREENLITLDRACHDPLQRRNTAL
jgi:5-methylcytosine-specific restriction endonuclease McrA